jgi:hypothetical protein
VIEQTHSITKLGSACVAMIKVIIPIHATNY